ncbi:hypothetical protein GGH14_003542 [Coemansia sp. RSA 370]|nr:hypothetical protein GGH14_003542 [Coemansia sp. RSA 370]
MATEHSPLLYTAYCPPPKPLSPEDIAQRRRSLGIESMVSADDCTFGLVPDYLSISVSDVISRKSSQSFRSELSAAGAVGGNEITSHNTV